MKSFPLCLAGAFLLAHLSSSTTFANSNGEANKKARKKTWDFAGFPLVNYTTDRGLGYGAYLAAFYFSKTPKPREPYRVSIGGQFYQTTGGYAFHKLLLDFPSLLNTDLRLDIVSGYEAWDEAKYFGVGNNLPRFLPAETPAGFYSHGIKSFWFVPTLRIPVAQDWSIFAKASLRTAKVNTIAGSLLATEAPDGSKGGFFPQLSLGILTDRRNQEPNTSRGYMFEASVRTAQSWLGSDFSTYGGNTTFRQWFEWLEDDRLIFCYRIALDTQQGEVPFFHQSILGGTQWVEIGGNLVLRGLPFGRYRGNTTAYSNIELRAQLFSIDVGDRNFELIGVTYFDAAKIWQAGEIDDFQHIHAAAGIGPRLMINKVFLVRLDLGLGLEEYSGTGRPPVDERALVFAINFIAGHPF